MSFLVIRQQAKLLKWGVVGFVAVFVLGTVMMYVGQNQGPAVPSQEYRFARVGNREILRPEFEQGLSGMQDMYRNFMSMQGSSLAMYSELPGYTWNQLLSEYAAAAAAEEYGVTISANEVRAEAKRQIEAQLEALGKGASAKDIAELRRMLEAQVNTDMLRRDMMRQRLSQQVEQQVRPMEYRIAQILIKTDGRTEEAAQKLAETVSKDARAGKDFTALVKQHSQDEATKAKDGVFGWVSAMPEAPATGKKDDKREPASQHPEPAVMAAALMLRQGETSQPVRGEQGYYIVKALEEREYQPASLPEPPKPDPKKPGETQPDPRAEALANFRSAAASLVVQGLVAEAQRRLEQTVEPQSPWLRGHLLEQKLTRTAPLTDESSPEVVKQWEPVFAAYEEALAANGREAGPALAYKLARMYQRANKHDKAVEIAKKWVDRNNDAELYMVLGESQQKLDKKTEALESFQNALKYNYNNPAMLGELAGKFRELGRKDLAKQATDKQTEQQARQAADLQRRTQAAADAAAQQQGGE